MRMYLSSYRIPVIQDLHDLLQTEFSESSVAIIVNAKDYKEKASRAYKLTLLKNDLQELGFRKVDFIDLNDSANETDLLNVLKSYDILYVAGGSTPALRIAMSKSGFDTIIPELLKTKLYIGESAGAYVVGPSIEVHEESDKLIGLPDLPNEGLGIIEEVIIPHADNPDCAEDIKEMLRVHSARGRKIIALQDNQAFIIKDMQSYVVTGEDNYYDNRLSS